MTDIVERLARVIADAMGDDYDDACEDKTSWIAERGMSGGRFRDCNEPFQSDYLAAAEAALGWTEAATEIERLRKHAEAMAGAIGLHLYLNNEERPEPYEEPEDNIYALMRARLAAYRAEYPEEK